MTRLKPPTFPSLATSIHPCYYQRIRQTTSRRLVDEFFLLLHIFIFKHPKLNTIFKLEYPKKFTHKLIYAFFTHFYNLMLPRTSLVLVNMGLEGEWGRSSLLNSALWIASTSGWNPRRTSSGASLRLLEGSFNIADGRCEGMGTLERKQKLVSHYIKFISIKSQ